MKMRYTLWIVYFAIVGAVVALNAQAQPTPVDYGKGFTLQWDYTATPDSAALLGFRAELNGSQVGADLPAGQTSLSFPAQVSCNGPQTLRVGSVWSGGVSWSQPIQFKVVNCPPAAPTNLRIVITISQEADGSFRLRVEQAEVLK